MNKEWKLTLKRWLNRPIVTYSFLAIQTIVYLLMFIPSLQIEARGVMFGPFVAYFHQYWRFITPIFIHFSLTHFAVNSIVFYWPAG